MIESPFHEGELALQEQTGVRERLAQFGGRFIRNFIPDQHREFFEQLPFLVVGSLDSTGQPWVSALAGAPGFMRSPDDQHLVVFARPSEGDPLVAALVPGAQIGLLGIEPHTRRRNRLNGRVTESGVRGFAVEVAQSFGNCPKYIQARQPELIAHARSVGPREALISLDGAAAAWMASADTFFIASAHPDAARGVGDRSHGVDVSHRGGRSGFVRVEGDVLTVPDYSGNFYFNTLGNLLVNPRCGLLFMDFDTGGVLQVTGRAEILSGGELLREFPGAQRLVRLHVTGAWRRQHALPLRWGPAELSPALAAMA
jgi:predicted pyridoxine 5'-phosphate oxidase superfamily flavin-nucleotide-binding protein